MVSLWIEVSESDRESKQEWETQNNGTSEEEFVISSKLESDAESKL